MNDTQTLTDGVTLEDSDTLSVYCEGIQLIVCITLLCHAPNRMIKTVRALNQFDLSLHPWKEGLGVTGRKRAETEGKRTEGQQDS